MIYILYMAAVTLRTNFHPGTVNRLRDAQTVDWCGNKPDAPAAIQENTFYKLTQLLICPRKTALGIEPTAD